MCLTLTFNVYAPYLPYAIGVACPFVMSNESHSLRSCDSDYDCDKRGLFVIICRGCRIGEVSKSKTIDPWQWVRPDKNSGRRPVN